MNFIFFLQQTIENATDATETVQDTVVNLFDKFKNWLPYLVTGIIVILISVAIAQFVKKQSFRLTKRTGADVMLAQLAGRVIYFLVLAIGFFVAIVVIFPGFSASDLISSLGIGSVAIGFATKDIIQNLFSGLLILTYRPFSIGDQIILDEYEGTIEKVQIRASKLRTRDGELVVIPNSELYLNTVVVSTGYPTRRSRVKIGVPNHTDFQQVKNLLLEAISKANGVVEKPSPSVHIVDLAEDTVILELRFWTPSASSAASHGKDAVTEKAKDALDHANIDLRVPKW